MNTGVYAFIFSDGRTYVGSTIQSFHARKGSHIYDLEKGKHVNPYFQNLYNKHGMPEFRILEECPRDECLAREQFWIDSTPKELLINLCPVAGHPGHHPCSEETKRKISEANKGRKPSLEKCRQHSEAMKGRVMPQGQRDSIKLAAKHRSPISEETRKKMSDAQVGKKHPGGSQRGRIFSQETIGKMSKAKVGKVYTQETQRKKSVAMKEFWRKKKEAQECLA